MSLGLARDSMINLAELASQKELEDSSENLSTGAARLSSFAPSKDIKLEDGQDDNLVMRLSTHEIGKMDMATDGLEIDPAEDEERYDDAKPSIDGPPEMVGDHDSVNSDTASQLGVKQVASLDSTSQEPSGTSPTSYGSYAGFAADYSEYEHYGHYSAYSGIPVVMGEKNSNQSFWCCLFPWMAAPPPLESEDNNMISSMDLDTKQESLVTVQEGRTSSTGPPSRSGSKDDDEVSTGSDVFGEKLSDKDRQAVLARLRLAQPDATGPVSPPMDTDNPAGTVAIIEPKQKGLLNGIVSAKRMQMKGILRKASTISRNNLNDALCSGGNSTDGVSKRRSLFPSYETVNKPKKNLHVEFSPMARVLTVKSHKDMDEDEKGGIWWQRSDYEEFRKTGRMITKAMLEGGSEIWLATNQSWQLPNKDRQSTLKHAVSLAEQHAAFTKGDITAKKEYEETRDKWWHKFGHSRRGLEHIASIDEGRQRQTNVKTALRAVIEEQRRQKVFHREDPEKLRMVSIQHTSWARDLALAAGASDADAVQMNFDDGSRKSREFYLLKLSRTNQTKVHSTQKASVPAFMKPAMTLQVQPSRLDANTVPQIRYRQAQHKRHNSLAQAPASTSEKKPTIEETAKIVPIKSEEDISISKPSSMAKQAAGFASGEEIGNMSTVLTGMGAIPVVGGP